METGPATGQAPRSRHQRHGRPKIGYRGRSLEVALLLLSWMACRHLAEAPSGLEDSLHYLYREFYSDDETLAAGLTGLLDWVDADGDELLGERADLENVGAFQLGSLAHDDLLRTPVEGDPDPALAGGVVSVASMGCDWKRAEALLVRGDQDVIFEGTWDSYQRDYDTARSEFEAARDAEIEPVREEILEEELLEKPTALLITRNAVQTTELTFTLDFDLVLHFRHGRWEIQGEEREAFLILGFVPEPSFTDGGKTGIAQSYSIDVNIAQGGETLRVFGAWSELVSSILESDSPFILSSGVNKAQDTAERLSEICAGELQIPGE
jgi:hypothetical protein